MDYDRRIEIRKVQRGYILMTEGEEYVFADMEQLIEWQKIYFGEK